MTSSNPILNNLKKNPFVLAPMAGITDHAFRSFIKKQGASVVITELVSATGIDYQSERTLKLMSFDASQHPVGIQLFGENPDVLASAAVKAQNIGCDFIDLNFGCPVPKVTKKGAGSAMLKDLKALATVLRTVKSAIQIPLSIKIRTGWDSNSRNAHEVCHIAFNEGVMWVAIHGRTRAQNYSGFADWDYIAEIKSYSKVPIIGNGDLTTPQKVIEALKKSECDGVMIGRGCLKDPGIFKKSLALWMGQENLIVDLDYSSIFLDLKKYVVAHCDERLVGIQLKKYAAWFATGRPGASQFRKKIFQCKNNDEIVYNALEFFKNLNNQEHIQEYGLEQTGEEPFLMGGHG